MNDVKMKEEFIKRIKRVKSICVDWKTVKKSETLSRCVILTAMCDEIMNTPKEE